MELKLKNSLLCTYSVEERPKGPVSVELNYGVRTFDYVSAVVRFLFFGIKMGDLQ